MRAWQVQGTGEPIDVLHEVEVEPPEPGPGQVRIRVTAAGIGLPDVFMCRGTYPLTPPLPFTSGQEATGVGHRASAKASTSTIGARVMCVTAFWMGHGSFAEECLVAADSVFPIPAGLTDAGGGRLLDPAPHRVGRARRSRAASRPATGSPCSARPAAAGSRPSNSARRSAPTVIAVVSDDERAAFCRDLGADATVNHRDGPLAPRVPRRDRRRTVSTSIYDPVGGALAEDAAGALARYGRLLAVGFASGRWPKFAAHDLVVTNTSLVGVFAGGYTRDELDAIHAQLAALVADGRLRNAVHAEVPFARAAGGAAATWPTARVVGKLVMVP